MTDFKLHTKETAPQQSAELLAGVEEKYGFIPNLMSVFAASPLDDPLAARLFRLRLHHAYSSRTQV